MGLFAKFKSGASTDSLKHHFINPTAAQFRLFCPKEVLLPWAKLFIQTEYSFLIWSKHCHIPLAKIFCYVLTYSLISQHFTSSVVPFSRYQGVDIWKGIHNGSEPHFAFGLQNQIAVVGGPQVKHVALFPVASALSQLKLNKVSYVIFFRTSG